MRYRYVNSFQNLCYDFAGGDEVIFTIVLFVLQKVVGHPVRNSEVNLAIYEFRDNGRALASSIYAGVECAWEYWARFEPFMPMLFLDDPVDVTSSPETACVWRQCLWNQITSELRFPDNVEIDPADANMGSTRLLTQSELRKHIRNVIGPCLRDRLERALSRSIVTTEVLRKMAETPLGIDHDLPDLEAERERFWRAFRP